VYDTLVLKNTPTFGHDSTGTCAGVQGSGFRVQGSGFRVQGSGFRV
jgi:hypothetical protein